MTVISAGFESPDMAERAMGRIQRSGINFYGMRISDETPGDFTEGNFETGDLRPGRRKNLFETTGDGTLPDGDVFSRGSKLTVTASPASSSELCSLLRNSGALGLRIDS